MIILIVSIAFFVASVAALIYGYIRNNRNIMLGAALALFLSLGLREFIHDTQEEIQAGYREGFEAGQRAKSGASAGQGR